MQGFRPLISLSMASLALGAGHGSFAASEAKALIPTDCGEYQVTGTITGTQEGLALELFGKTLSATRLRMRPDPDLSRVDPSFYGAVLMKGQKVRIQGTVPRLPSRQRGELLARSIQRVVPDFLDPSEGDGFRLLKKVLCAGEFTVMPPGSEQLPSPGD